MYAPPGAAITDVRIEKRVKALSCIVGVGWELVQWGDEDNGTLDRVPFVLHADMREAPEQPSP
jgi:hypothetical protein